VKKCASCTKDLPDAALHCVFCGAKQAPAPATAGGMAKTVMGAYSASDMIEHLKQQGAAPPQNVPAAAPYRPAPSPSQPPPAYQQPPQQAYQPPQPQVPASAANAKTVFVQGGGPPPGALGGSPGGYSGAAPAGAFGAGGSPAPAPAGGAYGSPPSPGFGAPMPASHPVGTSPSHVSSVPLQAPVAPAPVAAIPSAAPPYLASQTARAGRPIEPWKDALRVMMFIWGGVLLAAFATPLSTDPLAFNWDLIANAEGTAKLPPLIMAAVGLLSIAIASIPMSPAPRGIIAALLGLAGVFVPILLAGMPPWQALIPLVGLIVLIPSLFVREEYRDATVSRILITFGVAACLLPYLLPRNGSLPLVELFKFAIDAPGALKVVVLLMIAQIAIMVLSLLAWMPAPASGGAKIFGWLLILWPLVMHVVVLVLGGNLGDVLSASPYAALMAWVAGLGGMGGGEGGVAMMMGLSLGVAYAVLIGYGLATVIGKKLE